MKRVFSLRKFFRWCKRNRVDISPYINFGMTWPYVCDGKTDEEHDFGKMKREWTIPVWRYRLAQVLLGV